MADSNDFKFEMNVGAVMSAINAAADRALIEVGQHMKAEIAEGRHGDTSNNVTGEYARSIDYSKPSGNGNDRRIRIGSSLARAIPYEYGSGIHGEKGGRTTPWWYRNDKGEWIRTRGSRPSKRMRGAFRDEREECKKIIRENMKDVKGKML